MFGWIVAIVLGILAWLFARFVGPVVCRSLTARDARLDDRLEKFDGTHGVDKVLGPVTIEGVARLYEKMCVLEPAKWAGDPRIPSILNRYRDIVSGKEKDPEGLNVPSPKILGRPNPDYERYIRNQRRHSKSNDLKVAGKWARKARLEQEIRDGFDEILRGMGMPENLIPYAITDDRLDSYSQQDWRNVVKACRNISERYSEELAVEMLMNFTEAKILCSEESADTFDVLFQKEVPSFISNMVVRGDITMSQAEKAVCLVSEWHYRWEDAITEVILKDSVKDTDESLRRIYAKNITRKTKVR